jgi:hypothetical protein
LSIDTELEQIKREEQNWDVHGIPEIDARLPYTPRCECTPDMCEHVLTRKERKTGRLVKTYQCTRCRNDTTIINPIGEWEMT